MTEFPSCLDQAVELKEQLIQDILSAMLTNDQEKEKQLKEHADLLDRHIASLEQSINMSGLDFF